MDALAEKTRTNKEGEGEGEGEGLRIADVGTGTGYVLIHYVVSECFDCVFSIVGCFVAGFIYRLLCFDEGFGALRCGSGC